MLRAQTRSLAERLSIVPAVRIVRLVLCLLLVFLPMGCGGGAPAPTPAPAATPSAEAAPAPLPPPASTPLPVDPADSAAPAEPIAPVDSPPAEPSASPSAPAETPPAGSAPASPDAAAEAQKKVQEEQLRQKLRAAKSNLETLEATLKQECPDLKAGELRHPGAVRGCTQLKAQATQSAAAYEELKKQALQAGIVPE
jgi:hypothetical protein